MFRIVTGLPGDFSKLNKLELEQICKGRSAAIMTDGSIVRSTTIYQKAPYKWDASYLPAVDEKFNNAMIELYTDEYRTMKFHSDLALDLVPKSYIGIYSCYPSGSTDRRKLVVKNKLTGEITDIALEDKTMVLFDTDTNSQYLHKITGRGVWFGITFRLSNTYADGLRLATDEEKKEFLRLRKLENKSLDFKWDSIEYTLSPGDLQGDLLVVQDNHLSSN